MCVFARVFIIRITSHLHEMCNLVVCLGFARAKSRKSNFDFFFSFFFVASLCVAHLLCWCLITVNRFVRQFQNAIHLNLYNVCNWFVCVHIEPNELWWFSQIIFNFISLIRSLWVVKSDLHFTSVASCYWNCHIVLLDRSWWCEQWTR